MEVAMRNNDNRKRILVTEMELLKLWANVQQVIDLQNKKKFEEEFKQLLKDADLVNCFIQKKGGNYGG